MEIYIGNVEENLLTIQSCADFNMSRNSTTFKINA